MLSRVAPAVSPLFTLALLLAHETGHRIGAINTLRWTDVDLERGVGGARRRIRLASSTKRC
jgi:integrase